MAKKIDTSTILIERIIVHSIPKHKKGDYSILPEYSENESFVPDGLRDFFKDKVIQSFNSKNEMKVCYDSENVSPASTYLNEIINDKDDVFVEKSKQLTRHLFEVQVGNNASGILVIIFGKVNDKNTCILLKLERDKGAQLKLDLKRKTFDIEEVKDLMLTEKTKIYKVGMFIQRDSFGINFDGVVADLQINIRNKRDIQSWFMQKFLGCKPYEDPKITTHRFYNLTTTFIQTVENPVVRAKYTQDLNSFMTKNDTSLSAQGFANDYMETQHKDDYRKYLLEKKFGMSSFVKDISNIERRLKQITMIFENGITILGKNGTFDDKVNIQQLENGVHKAEIISKIKSVK